MVKHIVCWKFTDRKDAERVKTVLESMRGKIPGLIAIETGVNFSADESAADLVLYSEFESRAALDAYADHPVHAPVKQFIKPLAVSRMVVDYEN